MAQCALILEEVTLQAPPYGSGVSLLFAAGERPTLESLEPLLSSTQSALPGAMVSHRPSPQEGWFELLANGLTFEMHGLVPSEPAATAPPAHRFGPDLDLSPDDLESVALVPGPHIAGGAGMAPVVRTITGLAANLALALPTRAICWQPVGSWIEPRYFARMIVSWLSGGPFPALGLTALVPDDDGVVRSEGLAFFCGQEVHVASRPGEPVAQTAKLALRMIDAMVSNGALERRTEFAAPSGETVIAEPSTDGDRVIVWRGR